MSFYGLHASDKFAHQTGAQAAGLLLMDRAMGRVPREVGDALEDALGIGHRTLLALLVMGVVGAGVAALLLGLILGRDANGVDVGVHAVGQREVHDAVLTAEGHCRFCRFLCQRVQARATSTGKDHCHNFFCHSFILPFNINISVVRK
jgi:hypothetical protein